MNIDTATAIAQSPAVWSICTIILAFGSFKYLGKKAEKTESLVLEMYKEDRIKFDLERKEYIKQLDKYNRALEKHQETQKEIVYTIRKMDEKFDQRLAKLEKCLDSK